MHAIVVWWIVIGNNLSFDLHLLVGNVNHIEEQTELIDCFDVRFCAYLTMFGERWSACSFTCLLELLSYEASIMSLMVLCCVKLTCLAISASLMCIAIFCNCVWLIFESTPSIIHFAAFSYLCCISSLLLLCMLLFPLQLVSVSLPDDGIYFFSSAEKFIYSCLCNSLVGIVNLLCA